MNLNNLLKEIFSVKNSSDKRHKITTIFGFKIKTKTDKYSIRKIIKEQNDVANYVNETYIKPYLNGSLKTYDLQPKQHLDTEKIIWQYWAQGIDETTPDIVKTCLDSVDKYKGDYKRIILTDETIKDYIDFPDFIYDKLHNNKDFTHTFFSDLLRVSLLELYGGVWIDATILLTNKIPQEYLNKDFFAYQRTEKPKSYKKWQKYNSYYFGWDKNFQINLLSSFMVAKKNNQIIKALREMLFEYWNKENTLSHYFLMHLMFDELVKTDSYKGLNCEKISDLLPHIIQLEINKKYTKDRWKNIIKQSPIHKLTYFKDVKKHSILAHILDSGNYPPYSSRKIGILLIALGRYTVFWKDFYKSCEKNFLPNDKKTYYLFTDNKNIEFKNKNNVVIIPYKKMGWPYDSMMRFDMFLQQRHLLEKEDFLFFFNIDILFKNKVYGEILPSEINDGLMTGSHPVFYNKKPDEYTYDRNPKSTAYIPYGEGKHYATGAINGGTTHAFLTLCEVCSKNTHIDLENDVIALWHDESHLNKYLVNKNPLIMPLNYLYPYWQTKEWLKNNEFKDNIKIAIRDKAKYGGHGYLRGHINIKYSLFNKWLIKFLSKAAPTKNLRLYFKDINSKMVK